MIMLTLSTMAVASGVVLSAPKDAVAASMAVPFALLLGYHTMTESERHKSPMILKVTRPLGLRHPPPRLLHGDQPAVDGHA